jgi:multidrug efflux pump subunit AcrA (membrane-fusion protein)
VRPGFLARAELTVERVTEAILVPGPAVLRGSEVPQFVYVVDAGRAAVRPVTVRTWIGGRALIAGGLAPGDEIVVEGMGRLRQDATVEVVGQGRAS